MQPKYFIPCKAYQHRVATKERRNDLIDLIVDELNKAKSGAKKEEKQEFEDEFEVRVSKIKTQSP